MNGTAAQAGEVVRSTVPPVAVSGLSLLGVTLNEWVYVITIVYTLMQIIRVLPKTIKCGRCFLHNGQCVKEKNGGC